MGRLQEPITNTESDGISTKIIDPDDESKDVNGTIGGKNQVPEISLEWADIKVSFRIVPDFELENDLHKQHYELFPKLDTCAPSARTIQYLRKKAYKEKNNGTTLSSLLGIPRNQPTPTSEKVRPSPQSSSETSGKLNLSAENSSTINESPNSSANATPTIRRVSNGEGTKNAGDTPEGPHKCPHCGKGFTKTTYLNRHILSHSSVKPYKCDICNWGFFQQCNLKRHMASHSVENGAQGFKCEHCSANFTTKSVLSVHLREEHGDKLVTKKEAQKAANASDKNNSSGTDNAHQMIMKGPKVNRGFPQRISVGRGSVTKNIRGSFGGVVFRNKSALQSSPTNTSIRSPSNTPPDTLTITKNVSKNSNNANGWSRCHICNKKFLTPENLKQHMALHQGGKPFRCNFCNLRFAQKINLKKHVQASHKSGSGHPCPQCNMNFRTREDVAQHVLKQHAAQALSNIYQRSQPLNSAQTPKSHQDGNLRSEALAEVQISLKEVPTQVMKNNDNSEDNCKEEEQIDDVEEEEIMDDEEEMEIPSPEDGSPDHFVIQGAPVISSPPQMVGGALPRLPPLPRTVTPSNKPNVSNTGGAYSCTICMESFAKVSLLNKHIISKHSTGTTLTPTVQGSNLNL